MITVIIPTYNAEKTICGCLKSVIAQCTETEIIVADDGSIDATIEQTRKYSDRVRILPLLHSGVSAARNAGLAAANGEWVLFLDSDDMLLPGALEKLVPYMTEDNDAVCGTICRGNEKCKASRKISSYPTGHELIDFVLADPTDYLTIHAWAFRMKREMPRFDSELRLGEDSDWVLKYLYTVRKAMFVPVLVYRYTLSDNSTVHTWREGQSDDYLKMVGKISREKPGKERNWPLFVLTNYLLILTHAVFHPLNPYGRKAQFHAARMLRDDPMIADAFEKADLSKLSLPKRIVLACLRRGWFRPAYAAIAVRQRQNHKLAV